MKQYGFYSYVKPNTNIKTRSRMEQITEVIKTITDSQEWEECKTEVKQIYNAIKPELTEAEQDQLVLDIFLMSGSFDTFTEFWNDMNR